jgi:DNA primase
MPEYDRDLQTTKEEIRARSDIVEVIGQYTRLKRSGKNWTGLCPFHADKKPSFSVSPATQSYRCWSCGEKGDVFTFVEKKENLEFIEALELLARRAGIAFERRGQTREQASEREQMFAINALAARYYQERLGHSPDAQAYLAGRGILKPTQEQWDLGFAPDEWEGLSFFLQRQRADLAIAAKLGLIRTRDPGGRTYDTFRNRLMFPIHDLQGRVIAFGGRAMGDDAAKYLNSEQSPLFDKSRTLYGLVFARKAITPERPAVFVEGYVDVITTHQAGFGQCVATLGTSMTEEHARLLARYSPKVIICYDADSAGIKATLRGAAVWESIGVEGAEVRVARLPAGEDPDSLVRGARTADFQLALDKAVPRAEFEIELALQRNATDTDDGRSQALAEIIPILASIPTLTQRDKYAERVAHLHPARKFNFQRAIDALLADVELYARRPGAAQSARAMGFPLTEQANRGPLANEPAPPNFRAPTSGGWGRWEPGRQGAPTGREGRPGSPQGGSARGASDGRYRRREARDPLRDYSPPSLAAPPLTGPEKAERQLLRALFSADWRSYVLGRLHPDLLITRQAREIFLVAARMPAREDGTIDAALVLRELQAAEADAAELQSDAAEAQLTEAAARAVEPSAGNGVADSLDPRGGEVPRALENGAADRPLAAGDDAGGEAMELFSAAPEEMGEEEANPLSARPPSENIDAELDAALSRRAAEYRASSRIPAKTSDLIREVLEDSLSVMSNEPLSEAVLVDCIRRLQQHREEQARRELTELLNRTDLTPLQRQTTIQQYHEKMRQSRGSPPVVEDDNA